jgi:hypothetical protein
MLLISYKSERLVKGPAVDYDPQRHPVPLWITNFNCWPLRFQEDSYLVNLIQHFCICILLQVAKTKTWL